MLVCKLVKRAYSSDTAVLTCNLSYASPLRL